MNIEELLLLLCRNSANGTYIVGIQNGSILKQHVVTFKVPPEEKSGQRCDTQVSHRDVVITLLFVCHFSSWFGKIVPIKSMPGCFRLSWKVWWRKYVVRLRTLIIYRLYHRWSFENVWWKGMLQPNKACRGLIKMLKNFQTWLSLQTLRWTHIRRMVTMALWTKAAEKSWTTRALKSCKQALCHARRARILLRPATWWMVGRRYSNCTGRENFKMFDFVIQQSTHPPSGPFVRRWTQHRFGDKKLIRWTREMRVKLSENCIATKAKGPISTWSNRQYTTDIIQRLRQNTTLPLAAYQVSGEYAMLKAASQNGWLEEKKVVMESFYRLDVRSYLSLRILPGRLQGGWRRYCIRRY